MKKNLLLCIFLFSVLSKTSFGQSVIFTYGDDVCNEGQGFIMSSVSGGTPPYTYLWSNGATSADLIDIPAGTYTITVTDFIGITATASATLISGPIPLAPFYSSASTLFPCHGQCNGWMGWTTSLQGTPPFTFSSDVGTVNHNPSYYPGGITIEGLCDGIPVTVMVTDALGCTGQAPNVCMDGTPATPNPNFNITPANNSLNDGSVTVVGNIPLWWGCQLGYGINMIITTDTNSASAISGVYSSTPFTVSNLYAGNYFLQVYYYQPPFPSDSSCTDYIPFTIPSIGPNSSTVQGDVYVDANINCTEDAGEIGVPYTVIEFTPGPYYAYTNSSGHYSTYLPWGNYNMVQYPPVDLDLLCPVNPFPISLSSMNTSDTVNFADTSNIPFDVAAYISHGAAHPGFNFNYGVSVQNLSNNPSGIMTVTLNYDPLLSFVAANPAPFSTSGGQVVWQLSSITNFQSTFAYVFLSVPNNPSLIGYLLNPSVNVSATAAETNLSNNTASTWHIITGPFDPNVKTVEQPAATFIPATDGLFNYTIQFQNTGNDTAFNVELIDTLDSDLNVTTFVPGASSHPYTIDITGQGVIHFYFNNIYLPDSTTDEPNSHGFISFQIHSKQNLPHGTVINNQSDIVFDFNPPVATNITQNTVDLTLAVQATATTICAGQSVTLTMIPQLQGTPWRWRTGTCSGVLVGSGNSITVSPTVTTTYYVRDSAGTIPVGSCYRKTIVVNPLPTASITPNGPTTFCAGNSVLLTAGGANNYLWSNSSTSQSISVSSSGNYLVTVTDANNCSALTSLSVTVNPLPAASITPNGPTTFCAGNSVMLTAGGANNYLWSDNSTSQSINVSSSGNYFVTVTDGNNCSASTSLSVTVNPLPTASITPNGPTAFCAGNSVMLTAGGANNYLWSNSSTTQSITVSSSGNYFVTVTDGNNCFASTSLSVTVNSLPTASITPNGPTTFCAGNSVLLTAGGANNYLWSNSSTSQSITVSSSGNYFVTVTDGNNCSASASFSVTVNPNPPVPNITQNSDSLISDVASGYQWYFNSVLIPGATSQSYHPIQNGNYSVVVTDVNNCTASSADYPFILTGEQNINSDNSISVFPNPATNEIRVESLKFKVVSVEVWDVVGREIKDLTLNPSPKGEGLRMEVDVSKLVPGIYFVKVRDGKGNVGVGKFVKE